MSYVRKNLLASALLAGLALSGADCTLFAGGNCNNGDTKELDDACNWCLCDKGSWVCTLKNCDTESNEENPEDDLPPIPDNTVIDTMVDPINTVPPVDETMTSASATGGSDDEQD